MPPLLQEVQTLKNIERIRLSPLASEIHVPLCRIIIITRQSGACLSDARYAILFANQMLQIASDTPLFEVVGARVPALRRLEKMGIKTVRDLLWHFPTRYEDFTKVYPIAELEPGQQATITGVVEEIQSKHSWRRAMSIVEATIADESGSIRAVWFNQPYVANVLKTGRAANFAGKASVSEEGEIYLSNPVYEVIHLRERAGDGDGQEMNHTARLVPVYPETRGLTSRGIRFVTQALFHKKPVIERMDPRRDFNRI